MSQLVLQLNLRHLRAVAATHRCGSISAAAAEVNLSQPAVTQGVAKLESLIGTVLFDRHPGGVIATEAGLIMAACTEAAFRVLAEGFEAIRRPSNGGAGRREHLLTMTQVRAFLTLAAAGSFVGAAVDTGLSQPSLHRAVRDLERLSRIALVERRGRGVALTRPGRRLARAFSLAISELGAGIDEIAFASGGQGGVVRVGAMPLARARILPLALAAFHRDMPGVSVEIVEGSYSELVERLRDGTLDFLIGALRTPDPGSDVEQTALFQDELVAVARSGHPLSAAKSPTLEQLAAFPWVIARQGTPLRTHWEALFRAGGREPPHASVVCGSLVTIRTLLLETEFLTLLSPNQVRDEIAAGRLVAVGAPIEQTRRPIGLTTRSAWRPGPAHARLLDALRSAIADMTLQQSE